jgi:peptidoglycan/xylan/chitin deacetylase (PgdA/CDA1 family)
MMTRSAFYRVRTKARMIALTFDDGPDARVTPAVLALLAHYRAHATFFVVGSRALALPALVRAESDAGDEIGNHTFDHPHLMKLTAEAARLEIVRCDEALDALGLRPASLFRPPYGLASATDLREAMALGHRMVLWSVAVDRLDHGTTDEAAARAVVAAAHPGDIVLAHDCCAPYDRMRTVRILAQVIPLLQARGYAIVTVSDLLDNGSV